MPNTTGAGAAVNYTNTKSNINCALFINCIREVNNTLEDDA